MTDGATATAARGGRKAMVPAPVVGIAQWVVPGLGYWLVGERVRGVVVGVTVYLLFGAGVLIGGARVVELPDVFGGRGAAGSFVGSLASKPWALGQFWMGPAAYGVGAWSDALASDPATAGLRAHAPLYDVGAIYTAVAGMLNLLALIDATGRAMPAKEGA